MELIELIAESYALATGAETGVFLAAFATLRSCPLLSRNYSIFLRPKIDFLHTTTLNNGYVSDYQETQWLNIQSAPNHSLFNIRLKIILHIMYQTPPKPEKITFYINSSFLLWKKKKTHNVIHSFN